MEKISRQIEIKAPLGTVFDLFSTFSHFQRWMKGVKKVEQVDAGRTRWMAHAPDGTQAEWEAEITNLTPGRQLEWRAAGANIMLEGEASFKEIQPGVTLLQLALGYDAPEGTTDRSTVTSFNQNLEQRLEDDLIWFRLYIERELQAANGADSLRRAPASSLPLHRQPRPSHSLAKKSSAHFATFSSIRRAGYAIRPARLVTSFLTDVGTAVKRRAGYAPIVVNLDQPTQHRSEEATAVLTTRRHAATRLPVYRALVASLVVIGLLFITSAGLIQASRWPTVPNQLTGTAAKEPASLSTESVQHDKPSAAAGLNPTPTFEPEDALLPAAAAGAAVAASQGQKVKPQAKGGSKRARDKRSATRWVTFWLKPVVKPFQRKKAARRD